MTKLSHPRITLLAVLTSLVLVGCGDGGMTKAEVDKHKTSPAMTEEDRQRVADGMAKGAADRTSQQEKWAAGKSPEEIAQINAERAKMGRPPLGGGQ